MSRALNVPVLRREWRMSQALKAADLAKNIAGESAADTQARWDAIQQRHDERAEAIFAAILQAENASLSIRDAWAILNLALCVNEDGQDPETALPLFRKAERALRALRDAKPAELEGPTLKERRSNVSHALRHIEYEMQELLALMRLLTGRAKEIDTAATGMEGAEHDREYELRNDVLSVLEQASDKARRVDETALGCVRDAIGFLQ
jgi:hypothetical protein